MLPTWRRATIGVLAVFSWLSPGIADDVKPFETVLSWGQVIDPVGNCSFDCAEGKFTIKVPGEYYDLWPGQGKVNAPLVVQEVEADFTIEVLVAHIEKPQRDTRIAGLAGTTSFHAGSLVIWQDAKNFVRFDRTQMDRSGQPITSCYLHIFKDGARIAEVAPVVPDRPTHLRLTRKGDTLTAAYSQDGSKTWKELAPQKIDLPAKVKAGIAALNNTTRGNTVTFEGLKIEK
jgi:hypothetical protein